MKKQWMSFLINPFERIAGFQALGWGFQGWLFPPSFVIFRDGIIMDYCILARPLILPGGVMPLSIWSFGSFRLCYFIWEG